MTKLLAIVVVEPENVISVVFVCKGEILSISVSTSIEFTSNDGVDNAPVMIDPLFLTYLVSASLNVIPSVEPF